MVVEHKIDFPERTVLGFRQAKPAPYIAQQIGAGVEKTGFGAPIPC